jgi:hypothetical protein
LLVVGPTVHTDVGSVETVGAPMWLPVSVDVVVTVKEVSIPAVAGAPVKVTVTGAKEASVCATTFAAEYTTFAATAACTVHCVVPVSIVTVAEALPTLDVTLLKLQAAGTVEVRVTGLA